MKTKFKLSIFASALALGLAMEANAQVQPTTAAEQPAPGAAPVRDVVVVTGSLIARPNNVSVSPILSISEDLVQESGQITLEDSLNQLPGFTPAGGSATGGQGTGGRATLNLRGLGTNRNLVLLDGRRLPMSDISGNVDINILPESIIGNVDVITGGASAIYGSDAMSGVVNFKTVDYFDGVRADIQYGDSFENDLAKLNASFAVGSEYAENRGRVVFTFSRATREALSGADRSFFATRIPSSFIGTGTFQPDATNLPSQAAIDTIFQSYGVTATVNPTLNLGFNDDGTLFVQTGAINYQGPTTGGYGVFGGNVRMPVGPQIQLLNAFDRNTAFLKTEFDVNDGMTAYGSFLFVDSTVNTESGGSLTQFAPFTTIPVTNPFIPADLASILASRGNSSAPFQWRARYVGVPDKNWDEIYTTQQYITGLRGDLFADWTYDVFLGYDQSVHNQANNNAVLKSRVQTLLNAADGGASICDGGFNPFGIANALSLSDECRAYISVTSNSKEKLTQTQAQGQISGPIFELPAGPVQLALLASTRRNTYDFNPSADLTSNNIEGVVSSSPANGYISVNEMAMQIDVPLISGAPFAEELAVGAAYRRSDYNISGEVDSYEFDARWRPVDSLLIRGSFQRAVRAPNIGELYSPDQGVQVAIGTPPAAIGDPCDIRSAARTGTNGSSVRTLCLAQGIPNAAIDVYQFPTTATGGLLSGNLGLTPEEADTYNIGFVFNPDFSSPWLSGVSLSADYYNIAISNVISTINGLTVLSKCYNLDGSNPSYSNSNEFCQLINRDSTGALVNMRTPYLNLGALETDGVDVQVGWSLDLADAGLLQNGGDIYINSAIGWLNGYTIQTLPGTAAQDFGGTNTIGRPLPEWKALTTFGYRGESFSGGLRWRFQGAMDDISAVTTPTAPQVGVDDYNLFDIFGTYELNDAIQLRAGVNNLTDEDIPFVASSQNGADPGTFDIVGRSYYVGLKFGF